MSTDTDTDPIEEVRRADLVNHALMVEAFGEAFADFGTRLGSELRRRMVTELDREGTRPTWEAKGIGKIVLNVPEAKLAVRGAEEAEFTSWAAQRHPEQIVATIEVPTGDLENILHLLEEQGYAADATSTLTARSAWLKNWLENGVAEVVHDDGRTEYVEKSTGESVPGIFRKPAAEPHISRRIDKPRKDAVREAVADFLFDRLVTGIPAGQDPLALLSGPAPTADSDGEPSPEVDNQVEVESPECRCGHTGGQHRKGQKQYGKCLVTEPPCPCRRFTERTPE